MADGDVAEVRLRLRANDDGSFEVIVDPDIPADKVMVLRVAVAELVDSADLS